MNRKLGWLVAPFLLISIVACMCSGLQGLTGMGSQLQSVASQLPAMLTSAPTEMGAMETLSAQQSSASGTMTPGHLGISLNSFEAVLQSTQQLTFTQGTVNGQPATTATLTGSGASSFPALASGFSAVFIGDPNDLTEIRVTLPQTDQNTATQAMGFLNVILAGFVPPDVTLTLIPWLSQNYNTLKPGDKTQTTIKNYIFTLQRDTSTSTLIMDPAQ